MMHDEFERPSWIEQFEYVSGRATIARTRDASDEREGP